RGGGASLASARLRRRPFRLPDDGAREGQHGIFMMEQRNLIIAIALSIAILLGFQFLFEQPRVQQQAQQTATKPPATAPAATGPAATSPPGAVPGAGAPTVPGAPSTAVPAATVTPAES